MLGNKHSTSNIHAPKYCTTSNKEGRAGGHRTAGRRAYLQQLDALCERGGVKAGPAARGVDVALDGVVRLAAGLVEGAQVHPGGGVAVVQLNGADVGLQRVHRLVLLLVEHPGVEAEREGVILWPSSGI